MSRMRTLALGVLLAATASAHAALSPVAEREITHLLTRMAQSGCEFNRNGSWHGAAEASAHLQKKYDYLRNKNLLSSAEDFIAGAATQSSLSGQAYQVRCAGGAAVDSSVWFRQMLRQYRQKR